MLVAIIGLMVIGIKYMISSPDEKATIKDKLVIYVVGAVIMFSASGLVGLIRSWTLENVK